MPDADDRIVYLRSLRESLALAEANGHEELAERIRRTLAEQEGETLTGDAEPRVSLRDGTP